MAESESRSVPSPSYSTVRDPWTQLAIEAEKALRTDGPDAFYEQALDILQYTDQDALGAATAILDTTRACHDQLFRESPPGTDKLPIALAAQGLLLQAEKAQAARQDHSLPLAEVGYQRLAQAAWFDAYMEKFTTTPPAHTDATGTLKRLATYRVTELGYIPRALGARYRAGALLLSNAQVDAANGLTKLLEEMSDHHSAKVSCTSRAVSLGIVARYGHEQEVAKEKLSSLLRPYPKETRRRVREELKLYDCAEVLPAEESSAS